MLHANECPTCEGRGYFERTRRGGGFFAANSHAVEIECEECGGTGEIEPDEALATASESTVPMGRAA